METTEHSQNGGNEYFHCYNDLQVHQLMLEDKKRTLAYKDAILGDKETFKDKIVMDVGAGTGILSIFCAKAGAKKVYAVEASEIAKLARETAKENNFENVIEVIESRVEDLDESTVEKVDIIVSEWMGFYLLHEAMLDSVIVARNKFLKPDGLLFPSIAKLYAAPCQVPSFNQFWDDVYGVKMQNIGKAYRKSKGNELAVTILEEKDIIGEEKMLAWLDLKDQDLDLETPVDIPSLISIWKKNGRYQGICLWFEVEFPNGTVLSTSPFTEPTHWKQSVAVFPNDHEVETGEPLAFKVLLSKNSVNPRWYDLQFDLLDAEEVEHDMPCECYMTKCIVTRAYIQQQNKLDMDET